MIFRKADRTIISVLVVFVIVVYSIPLQADIIPLEGLKNTEIVLYGDVSEAAILHRIDTLELAIFGHKTKGSISERAQELIDYVLSTENDLPLKIIVPYMERTLYNRIKDGSLVKRIENIETSIYGEVQKNSLITRVEKLAGLLVPSGDGEIYKEVLVSQGTDLHIKIEEEINTAKLRVGKVVKFTLTDNLVIDGYLIVPEGTTGTLNITDFDRAGNFGKDASIKININDIKAIDGNNLSLSLLSNDNENYSKEIALGVSLLGTVIISNPVGLVAGYFFKGKDIVIPAGSVLKVQVYESTKVHSIKY